MEIEPYIVPGQKSSGGTRVERNQSKKCPINPKPAAGLRLSEYCRGSSLEPNRCEESWVIEAQEGIEGILVRQENA